MKNAVIAEMFDRMADVLELKGEISFKVNAYRRASRAIQNLEEDIETIWNEERLHQIPGIGTGLAKKIDEYLRTDHMSKYDEIVQSVPPELVDLLHIQNLGPKTLAVAYQKLHVENLEDLKKVLENGSLAQLPNMGEKKIENIRKGIALREKGRERISLGIALPLVERLIHELRKIPHVGRIYPAGSVRRMCETVGDIDILVEAEESERVIDTFGSFSEITRMISRGKTKSSVLIEGDLQVDLRVIPRDSFGAALQYFTGSKAHNVRLRRIAKKQGCQINEYGIFRGEKKIGGAKEEDIYEALGMQWIPPELREDRGEIDLAMESRLPDLVELYDINGDFHVHTRWSDGSASIEKMAEKAAALGYHFIGICDHSQSAGYANGLTPERILEQIREIERLNTQNNDICILAGTEVDILADGRLDYSDDLLARLNIVIAAVHSGFKKRVTERMIAAARNPHVTILAHPTGRLLFQREGYIVDLEQVIRACVDTGTALEINCNEERLDLNDRHIRFAKEQGAKLAIGTDAHHPHQMDYLRLGLGMARRGCCEKKDVLNCLSVNTLRSH
ncbi:DNA polymerase/3'-5' exonuclease PolX [bacterium]|nr:DNA polymerase/3'-5' exonuclease PolX [bacterium]